VAEDPFLAVIRLRVRKARLAQGLRQLDVAEALDIEQRSYQRFEAIKPDHGRFNPSVMMLRKIALAINLTLPELVQEATPDEIKEIDTIEPKRSRRTPNA
jgi:transcriptional regulator with XRE-family HTH domain